VLCTFAIRSILTILFLYFLLCFSDGLRAEQIQLSSDLISQQVVIERNDEESDSQVKESDGSTNCAENFEKFRSRNSI